MKLPDRLVLRPDERKRREEEAKELQRKRDERSKVISDLMKRATIPSVVVQIRPRDEPLKRKG
jgi:hypothetical protein